MEAILIVAIFLVALVVGVPIAIALGVSAVVYMLFIGHMPVAIRSLSLQFPFLFLPAIS